MKERQIRKPHVNGEAVVGLLLDPQNPQKPLEASQPVLALAFSTDTYYDLRPTDKLRVVQVLFRGLATEGDVKKGDYWTIDRRDVALDFFDDLEISDLNPLYLEDYYVAAVDSLGEDADIFGTVASLTRVGKKVSPYLSPNSNRRIQMVWDKAESRIPELADNPWASAVVNVDEIIENLGTASDRIILTDQQQRIIRLRDKGLLGSQIANEVGVPSNSVSQTIGRMLAKDLVERRESATLPPSATVYHRSKTREPNLFEKPLEERLAQGPITRYENPLQAFLPGQTEAQRSEIIKRLYPDQYNDAFSTYANLVAIFWSDYSTLQIVDYLQKWYPTTNEGAVKSAAKRLRGNGIDLANKKADPSKRVSLLTALEQAVIANWSLPTNEILTILHEQWPKLTAANLRKTATRIRRKKGIHLQKKNDKSSEAEK